VLQRWQYSRASRKTSSCVMVHDIDEIGIASRNNHPVCSSRLILQQRRCGRKLLPSFSHFKLETALWSTAWVLLYYITDAQQFSPDTAPAHSRLLDNIAEAARCGIDYIQIRERHLSARDLEKLALRALDAVRRSGTSTKLLINSRLDVAIATGADGVHLRANRDSELSASEARTIFHKAGVTKPIIAASCHTLEDIYSAEAHGADFVVFGPVFGKVFARPGAHTEALPGVGLDELRRACRREAAASSRMPVLALGGVTLANAQSCLDNGAAGIAAIRLFQPAKLHDLGGIVEILRKLDPAASQKARRHPYNSTESI
jgi:thiamine-phosphate diphosphorylase